MQAKHASIISVIVFFVIGIAVGYLLPGDIKDAGHGHGDEATEQTMDSHDHMEAMTDSLKDKFGADYEKAFLEEMIVHHQGALDMSNQLLQKTERPELVKFANDIIDLQSAEIFMMQNWLNSWYPHNH